MFHWDSVFLMTHFICGQVPLLYHCRWCLSTWSSSSLAHRAADAPVAAAETSVSLVIHLASLWSRFVSDKRETRHCLTPIARAWHSLWLRTLVGFAPQGFSCCSCRQVAAYAIDDCSTRYSRCKPLLPGFVVFFQLARGPVSVVDATLRISPPNGRKPFT